MLSFFRDTLENPFLQYAVAAALLAAIPCGVVGSLVVTRRMTYIAGAIAHSVLGGMGAARYLFVVHEVTWAAPLVGATISAIIAALIIAAVTLKSRERQDTVLSAIWAIGMAVGISFIHATPGYYEDLMSYLFGDILLVDRAALMQMAALDVLILGVVVTFYHKLVAIGFQPEMARLRGLRTNLYEVLFLVLTALTVVLLMQVVGLIMVIALLALPAATVGNFARTLWQMMLYAALLTALLIIGGLAISYEPELPAGATIIQLAGVVYLASLGGRFLKRRLIKPTAAN